MIMWKWLCSFVIIASAIVSVAYEQHYAREKYQAKAQAECIALTVSVEEKHSCAKKAQSRKDYAPWWNILLAWPEGITTWAIISTGFVIAWQSSETRKSAQTARDTFLSTQRPRIVVRTPYFSENTGTFGDQSNGITAFSDLKGQVYIANIGGTKATIKETLFLPHISDAKELPAKRPWEGQDGTRCNLVLASGKSVPHIFVRRDPLSKDGAEALQAGTKFLYVMGWVEYLDELDIRRTTRFCRLYDPRKKRFYPVDDAEYESQD
jgi:hypothetical protein